MKAQFRLTLKLKTFLVFGAVLTCSVQAACRDFTIGNTSVHCTDATGVPVSIFLDPSLKSDLAQSTILPNGMRVIKLNAKAYPYQPVLMQFFIFAHECGHHISGDVFAKEVLRHDNPAREMTADRIGIRMLRDQMNITPQEAQAIALSFRNNPPLPPYYLPGPLRAKWIIDCYNSTNITCNGSTVDYSQTQPQSQLQLRPAPKPKPTPTPDDSPFCKTLSKAIRLSPSGFQSIRLERGDIEGYWKTDMTLEGFGQSCEVLAVSDTDGEFICHSDLSYSDLKAKISPCLAGWDDAVYDNDKHTSLTIYSKDHKHTAIRVSEEKHGSSLEIEDNP